MIYFDSAATAFVHPLAKKAIENVWNEWANPSSIHKLGNKNKILLENLRKEAKEILNVGNNAEIIFTSSATESNNIVLNSSNLPILISQFEHSSIKNYPNVEKIDIFNLEALEERLKEKQYLVCCMLVQHETGIVFPIEKIAALTNKYHSKLHVDASQAKNVDFNALNCTSLTISGHKLGAPVGVAALVTKNLQKTFLYGGKQEFNVRSSTQNVPLIAGLVECLKIKTNFAALKEKFESEIDKKYFFKTYVNLNFCDHIFCMVLGSPGTELISFLDLNNIAISYGSACNLAHSGAIEGIHALKQFNHQYLISENAVRISFGWHTTIDDVSAITQKFNLFLK